MRNFNILRSMNEENCNRFKEVLLREIKRSIKAFRKEKMNIIRIVNFIKKRVTNYGIKKIICDLARAIVLQLNQNIEIIKMIKRSVVQRGALHISHHSFLEFAHMIDDGMDLREALFAELFFHLERPGVLQVLRN